MGPPKSSDSCSADSLWTQFLLLGADYFSADQKVDEYQVIETTFHVLLTVKC